MGASRYDFEVETSVHPARTFKAGILDAHNLLPKIMPQVVSSASFLEGDGRVGSIKQFKFTDVLPYTHVNERVDVLDAEKLEYKYTVTDGANVGTKLSSAVYTVTMEPSSKGGCICKAAVEYVTLSGVEFTEEDINAEKNGITGMIKAVEAYLLANPDAYA